MVTIEVPDAPAGLDPDGKVLHVDVRLTTPAQQRALYRLRETLNRGHAQTADGSHVDTAAAAIRCLLEKLDAAAFEQKQEAT